MKDATLWVLILAGVAMLFGFIALLLTKVYKSESTGETEFGLGALGKMKTNYPALAFVLVGGVLAMYAIKAGGDEQQLRSRIEKELTEKLTPVDWIVTGQIVLPPGSPNGADVRLGTLAVVPQPDQATIYQDGTYEIHLKLRSGVDFESHAGTILYTYPKEFGGAQIDPARELASFAANPDGSLLLRKDATSRKYKPVSIAWGTP